MSLAKPYTVNTQAVCCIKRLWLSEREIFEVSPDEVIVRSKSKAIDYELLDGIGTQCRGFFYRYAVTKGGVPLYHYVRRN